MGLSDKGGREKHDLLDLWRWTSDGGTYETMIHRTFETGLLGRSLSSR